MANQKTITAFSPAKINLGLIIKKKLKSGYHEVETIYQQVSLVDELSFGLLPTQKIDVQSNAELPEGDKNTIYRAITLLKEKSDFSGGVKVLVNKQIPVQAGLAGGSSNAATTLMVLNEMLDLGLTKKTLVSLAKQIGADVAYHLYGGMQREIQGGECAGVFEQLSSLPNCWIVLCFPGIAVSSQEAYQAWDKSQTTSEKHDLDALVEAINSQDLFRIGQELVNDFEPWFFVKYPSLISVKQTMLNSGAIGALLSGKGSSIYGLFSSKESAQFALQKLTPEFQNTYLLQPYEERGVYDTSKKN